MSHDIILTEEEKALFAKLPEKTRENWIVQDETLPIEDTQRRLMIRIGLMHFMDEELKELQKKVRDAKSQDDLVKLFIDFDFETLTDHDATELFFAMGPILTGNIIEDLLKIAETDRQVEAAAAISLIRHTFLESQPAVSA